MVLLGVPIPGPPERLTSLRGLVFVDSVPFMWYAVLMYKNNDNGGRNDTSNYGDRFRLHGGP